MKAKKSRSPSDKTPVSALIIVLNVLILTVIALVYGNYISAYRERLRQENIGNIANLNESASSYATALFDSWQRKLSDIIHYIDIRECTVTQALDFISDSNSSDDRNFQLIGDNYIGYLARKNDDGGYMTLNYENNAYETLKSIFDDTSDLDDPSLVRFTPEFTDSATALKYFAVCRHVRLSTEEGEESTFTLMLATKSKSVLEAFNIQSDFEGQSSVLFDADGDYIVSNADFKSTNFFQYLYVYNELTLDRRSQIFNEVMEKGYGELYYKNAVGEDCVFRYSRMASSDWYCVTCVPLTSFRTSIVNAGSILYAIFGLLALLAIDVIWLRYMNYRLKIAAEREKEASEAKTVFLSRMSHDIRTPLNGIIGLTTLAADENNPPETVSYLEKIKISGQFLLGLVNDVLDLSKVESGKVELHTEPYSARELKIYIDAVVAPLCKEKKLNFKMSEPGDELPVMLDRLRFNQVIFNLLSNAVKYTDEGGTIEFYWVQDIINEDRVALTFTIKDNGIGMSEEFQRHMFDSFSQERAATATTGVGLGLAIVKSLVKIMGGDIEVASKIGEGSTFTVKIQTDVCHGDGGKAEKDDGMKLSGKRMLLCEDNEINTIIIEKLLAKWGITVDAVVNGRLGVEKFSSSPQNAYDAVLMDVMMPEMNGIEAAGAIREIKRADAKTVPIIAMTANAYDTDVKNCMDAGMNAHVAKPIDPALLYKTLTELVKK